MPVRSLLRAIRALSALCAISGLSCAPHAPPAPPMSPAPPAPTPSTSQTTTATPSAACADADHHQMDFWIGDWDLTIRARKDPEQDAWVETRGTNHVRAIMGGCVVEESFEGDPTGQRWTGMSVSTYAPQLALYRQTWVDDQGSYLAFKGKKEGESFILYGEGREVKGEPIQMRMVFSSIRQSSLDWSWERGKPGGDAWRPMMTIHYVRR